MNYVVIRNSRIVLFIEYQKLSLMIKSLHFMSYNTQMKLFFEISIFVLLSCQVHAQTGLSNESIENNIVGRQYSKSSFLYEFDLYAYRRERLFDHNYSLALNLNIGLTKRLNQKYSISAYSTIRGWGDFGVFARVSRFFTNKQSISLNIGSLYRTSDVIDGMSLASEVSYDFSRHASVYVGGSYRLDNFKYPASNFYQLDLGLRTRGKAAGWTSGIVLPALAVLIYIAIGNSQ